MAIRGFLGASPRQALCAAVALGLVLGSSAMRAQAAETTAGSGGDADASASANDNTGDPGDPDAIVVHGQRRHPPRTYGIPPDKAAAFSKGQSWRDYRDSAPAAPTPGACPTPPDPTQAGGCSTFQDLQDYPGLRNIGQ